MIAALAPLSRCECDSKHQDLFCPRADNGREGGVMSRNLPDRPNLEFLKKEAKALLDSMQHADPAAQLADAQHALARDYGFASWPRLKAHVAGVAAAGVHPFTGRWVAD